MPTIILLIGKHKLSQFLVNKARDQLRGHGTFWNQLWSRRLQQGTVTAQAIENNQIKSNKKKNLASNKVNGRLNQSLHRTIGAEKVEELNRKFDS